MSLLVTKLSVRNFRSYEEFVLEPSPHLTVLVGPNGVGKTNLIEALQVLTTTRSFRKPLWSDVVTWGEESASVCLEAEGEDRHLTIELSIQNNGRREFRVNGKQRRRLMDVAGVLPCVVFTPEDLRLVKDSAERRRSSLDVVGEQLSPNYAQLSAEYERVVRQRNALLREERTTPQELEPWTEALVATGARFRDARKRLFARLVPEMIEAYETVAGAGLGAEYQEAHDRDGVAAAGLSGEEAIRTHLEAKNREERVRLTTLIGPHRDEIVLTLGGREARTFASQGQQRTIALAWKLAETAVVSGVSGQPPLLLLDDVMSELDERRRHALAALVGNVAQTIVTTTNLGYFQDSLIARAKVVELA